MDIETGLAPGALDQTQPPRSAEDLSQAFQPERAGAEPRFRLERVFAGVAAPKFYPR